MRTVITAALLAACATAPAPPPATAPTAPPTASQPIATTPAPTATHTADAPEISRSAGVDGGVVIFWPRVSPRSDDPQVRAVATAVQQRLQALVTRALPGRTVDLRPEPERVCPRAGCAAMTVGASLFHTNDGGCVVVALVSGAGQSPQRLVPWVSRVTLRETMVPFREPPENRIVAQDIARCTEVAAHLADGEEDVVRAIREAAPPH